MPTLIDVAKRAQVSVSTASVVLNPGSQAKRVSAQKARQVQQAARELGYIPNYHAQAMKRGRAQVSGIVFEVPGRHGPLQSPLSSPYWGTLVGGIEAAMRRAGSAAMVVGPDTHRSATVRAVDALQQRQLDGAVLLGAVLKADEPAVMDPPMLPMVVADATLDTPLPRVSWDERRAVQLAVDHLAQLGHRRLLWVQPLSRQGVPERRQRVFVEAARAAGLRVRELVVPYVPSTQSGDPIAQLLCDVEQAVVRGWADWRRAGPDDLPTAVAGFNDVTGIGVLRALAALGLSCPRQVSVLSFDNFQAALAWPQLTAVDHTLVDIGRASVELLHELIDGGEPAIREHRGYRRDLEPTLIVRQSTGPAPEQT